MDKNIHFLSFHICLDQRNILHSNQYPMMTRKQKKERKQERKQERKKERKKARKKERKKEKERKKKKINKESRWTMFLM